MRIDWLEGTIVRRSIEDALRELHILFCGLDWQELDRGAMGYTHSAIFAGDGRVYWCPERPDMGVHVSLPSLALDRMGVSAESVLSDLMALGWKCSRLDIAADDFEGYLDMSVIRTKVLNRELVSRAKKAHEDRDLIGGSGNTIYFGRRGSRSMMRIYDKSAEQADLHKGVYTHWVRAELEYRQERAEAAARLIAFRRDGWHELARGWFMAFLDFKVPGDDSNKSRWETCSWWAAFLNDAVKIRLKVDAQVPTVATTRRWVERQVVPGFYVLGVTLGYDALFDMILTGKNRLSERHDSMIAEYERSVEKVSVAG